jgi:hypothetical protein
MMPGATRYWMLVSGYWILEKLPFLYPESSIKDHSASRKKS